MFLWFIMKYNENNVWCNDFSSQQIKQTFHVYFFYAGFLLADFQQEMVLRQFFKQIIIIHIIISHRGPRFNYV